MHGSPHSRIAVPVTTHHRTLCLRFRDHDRKQTLPSPKPPLALNTLPLPSTKSRQSPPANPAQSKKSDQYKECTACLAKNQGQSADTLNGSLNRLCAQVSQIKSLSASASKTGKDSKETSKDKNGAEGLRVGAGVVAAAGVLAALF